MFRYSRCKLIAAAAVVLASTNSPAHGADNRGLSTWVSSLFEVHDKWKPMVDKLSPDSPVDGAEIASSLATSDLRNHLKFVDRRLSQIPRDAKIYRLDERGITNAVGCSTDHEMVGRRKDEMEDQRKSFNKHKNWLDEQNNLLFKAQRSTRQVADAFAGAIPFNMVAKQLSEFEMDINWTARNVSEVGGNVTDAIRALESEIERWERFESECTDIEWEAEFQEEIDGVLDESMSGMEQTIRDIERVEGNDALSRSADRLDRNLDEWGSAGDDMRRRAGERALGQTIQNQREYQRQQVRERQKRERQARQNQREYQRQQVRERRQRERPAGTAVENAPPHRTDTYPVTPDDTAPGS